MRILIGLVVLLSVCQAAKKCGDNEFVVTFEKDLILKLNNNEVNTLWKTYKESSATTTDKTKLGVCQDNFSAQAKVCCPATLIDNFQVILKAYWQDRADNAAKKPVCVIALKRLGKQLKKCGLKNKTEVLADDLTVDPVVIPPESSSSSNSTNSTNSTASPTNTTTQTPNSYKILINKNLAAHGLLVAETENYLRGILCLLCMDPDADAATNTKLWKTGQLVLNKPSYTQLVSQRLSALTVRQQLHQECWARVNQTISIKKDPNVCPKLALNFQAFFNDFDPCANSADCSSTSSSFQQTFESEFDRSSIADTETLSKYLTDTARIFRRNRNLQAAASDLFELSDTAGMIAYVPPSTPADTADFTVDGVAFDKLAAATQVVVPELPSTPSSSASSSTSTPSSSASSNTTTTSSSAIIIRQNGTVILDQNGNEVFVGSGYMGLGLTFSLIIGIIVVII